MAAISVSNTFTNGVTADASEVNTNFSEIVNGLSDGTKDLTISALTTATLTASGTVTLNGTTKFGSDSKATADALEFVGALSPGWLCNLGLSLSGGTLSIVDAGGTALSSTNLAYVTVPSTTAGQLVTLKVTAPASFNDDANASSDLTDLGFGITETVAWANDAPFFLYVVNRANSALDGADGSSAFFLSRDPRMSTTPSSGDDIGDTGTIPVNDSQDVILIMDAVTVGNYTSLPCQLIGALRMRWSTATDDWTVQALGNNDGFGRTQLDKTFATTWTFPVGQNGADASSHISQTSGTTPVFSSTTAVYRIGADGMLDYQAHMTGDGGTDGVGGGKVEVYIPYKTTGTIAVSSAHLGSFILESNSLSRGDVVPCNINSGPTDIAYFWLLDDQNTFILSAEFPNGDRTITGGLRVRVF